MSGTSFSAEFKIMMAAIILVLGWLLAVIVPKDSTVGHGWKFSFFNDVPEFVVSAGGDFLDGSGSRVDRETAISRCSDEGVEVLSPRDDNQDQGQTFENRDTSSNTDIIQISDRQSGFDAYFTDSPEGSIASVSGLSNLPETGEGRKVTAAKPVIGNTIANAAISDIRKKTPAASADDFGESLSDKGNVSANQDTGAVSSDSSNSLAVFAKNTADTVSDEMESSWNTIIMNVEERKQASEWQSETQFTEPVMPEKPETTTTLPKWDDSLSVEDKNVPIENHGIPDEMNIMSGTDAVSGRSAELVSESVNDPAETMNHDAGDSKDTINPEDGEPNAIQNENAVNDRENNTKFDSSVNVMSTKTENADSVFQDQKIAEEKSVDSEMISETENVSDKSVSGNVPDGTEAETIPTSERAEPWAIPTPEGTDPWATLNPEGAEPGGAPNPEGTEPEAIPVPNGVEAEGTTSEGVTTKDVLMTNVPTAETEGTPSEVSGDSALSDSVGKVSDEKTPVVNMSSGNRTPDDPTTWDLPVGKLKIDSSTVEPPPSGTTGEDPGKIRQISGSQLTDSSTESFVVNADYNEKVSAADSALNDLSDAAVVTLQNEPLSDQFHKPETEAVFSNPPASDIEWTIIDFPRPVRFHIVQDGETVQSIIDLLQLSEENQKKFQELNHAQLQKSTPLKSGEILLVPQSSE